MWRLGLFLLVLAGLGLWRLSEGSERDAGPAPPPPGDEPSGAPRLLAGQTPSQAPEAEPQPADDVPVYAPPPPAVVRTIEGRVVDEEGAPVTHAVVLLIPKRDQGSRFVDYELAASPREKGMFQLDEAPVTGMWLGATADGYLTTHLDGDALPPNPLRIVLRRGPSIQVRVDVDERLASSKLVLWTELRTPGEGFAYPNPDGRRAIERRAGLVTDVQTYHVGTDRAIAVRVIGGGVACVPPRIVLDPPRGEARFRLVPSASVRVRPLHADSGEPFPAETFDDYAPMARVEDARGRPVSAILSIVDDFEQVIADGLSPGTYTVKVEATGYETFAKTIRIVHEGERVELVAPMRRERALGFVDLRVRHESDMALRGVSAAWRRLRPEPQDWQVVPIHVEYGSRTKRIRVPIERVRPGTYDVLVWAEDFPVGNELVGLARRVKIEAGRAFELPITVRRGRLVALAQLPLSDPTQITVRGDGIDRFPLVRVEGNAVWSAEAGFWGKAHAGPPQIVERDTLLGKYPADGLVVEETLRDGSVRRHAIK